MYNFRRLNGSKFQASPTVLLTTILSKNHLPHQFKGNIVTVIITSKL